LFADLTDRGMADAFAQDGQQSLAHFPCGVAKQKGQQDQPLDTESPSSEPFEQDPAAKGSGAGNPQPQISKLRKEMTRVGSISAIREAFGSLLL
jgi:hypothetical protein